MVLIKINEVARKVDADPNTPLLWAIRENLKLTGTKFGCGIGQCGACTVHVDGIATKSCITSLAAVENRSVTTIEGVSLERELHPVQQAWIDHQVPQCGYCQSGQIMAAISFLDQNPDPTEQQINEAMQGNICRCGTYTRVRAAMKSASRKMLDE